jgi:hypothetical protein
MLTRAKHARSGDVNIAYQVVGDGPIDLVLVLGWVSHLAYSGITFVCAVVSEHAYLAGTPAA